MESSFSERLITGKYSSSLRIIGTQVFLRKPGSKAGVLVGVSKQWVVDTETAPELEGVAITVSIASTTVKESGTELTRGPGETTIGLSDAFL